MRAPSEARCKMFKFRKKGIFGGSATLGRRACASREPFFPTPRAVCTSPAQGAQGARALFFYRQAKSTPLGRRAGAPPRRWRGRARPGREVHGGRQRADHFRRHVVAGHLSQLRQVLVVHRANTALRSTPTHQIEPHGFKIKRPMKASATSAQSRCCAPLAAPACRRPRRRRPATNTKKIKRTTRF